MRIAWAAACIVMASVAGSALAEDKSARSITNGPTVAVEDSAKALARERLAKPAVFETWTDRLDFIENNFTYGLQTSVSRVDSYFGSDTLYQLEERPTTSLRLGMYAEFEEDSGLNIRVNPDVDVSVRLPNLEKNWKVFITGREIGEAPDTDPTERDRGVQVGVRHELTKYHVYFDAGLKIRWPPELFVQTKWAPHWSINDWRFHPAQQVFLDTDERFGELTSYNLFRWLGRGQVYLFALTGSGRWTEETLGVELRQSVKFARVTELIEEGSRGQNPGDKELARGVGVRYTISGHASGSRVIDEHRLTFAHRRPLYKNWLYVEVAPELKWRDESDWKTIPVLRLGVEALFWGFGRT